MKTQQQWFDEYAESHQNKTNQQIHFICVPAIYFSIVGILMSLSTSSNLLFYNLANLAVIIALLFYLTLSFTTFAKMLVFSLVCILVNYYLSQILPLFYISMAIFVIAWIGQFYGHKLEGKKPSFFKDLQFLLIGPAWVFEKITNKK
jgi:uncharacterized membrane protein YGL010W